MPLLQAQHGHQPPGQALQVLPRPLRPRRFRPAAHAVDDAGQERLQLREHGGDIGVAAAGVVAVQQRVIGRQAQRLAPDPGFLPDALHNLPQRRQEGGEIALMPRPVPDRLRPGDGPRLRFHQIRRQGGGGPVQAAHLAQIGRLPGLVRPGGRQRLGGIPAR